MYQFLTAFLRLFCYAIASWQRSIRLMVVLMAGSVFMLSVGMAASAPYLRILAPRSVVQDLNQPPV
jgi:hypothetical protein